jgi:hypothetical protein
VNGTVLADRIAPRDQTPKRSSRMTTYHRITTAVLVSLGLAISATPALALPTDLTPNGSEVPAGSPSVTSQPTSAGLSQTSPVVSPNPDQRVLPTGQHQLVPTTSPPSPVSPTIVRVVAPSGGFDWGDAGIGAAGGFALSMIVAGGALVASQRRDRRTHGSAALTG